MQGLFKLSNNKINCVRIVFMGSDPRTPHKLIEITGYFPIYSLQSSVFCEIYNPAKSAGSVPISKKERSMLIFKDFPKRRGLVKRDTFPPLSNSVFI